MKVCQRGHERDDVLTECLVCASDQNRRWQETHRESRAESARKYRAAHPERVRETKRKYRAGHLEKVRASTRDWLKANRENVRVVAKRWALANKAAVSAMGRRSRARRATAPLRDAHMIEPMLLALSEGCVYCGRGWLFGRRTMDHALAIVKGGAHAPDNIVPCCVSCNSSKCAHDLMPWLRRTYGNAGVRRYLTWVARREQWLSRAA